MKKTLRMLMLLVSWFGQSITAIAKLAPSADIGTGLSVHYSGGSAMPNDVSNWLNDNNVRTKE